MDKIEKLRQEAQSKIERSKALYAINVERELTPEERSELDQVKADVESLKQRIALLEEGEVGEDQPDVSAGRSTRPWLEKQAPAVHVRDAAHSRFSLTRAINRLAEGKRLDGKEKEVSDEIAHRQGVDYRGNSFYYPMLGGSLYRDLTTSSASGGVYTDVDDKVIEGLRAKMLIAKLGATLLPNLAPGKFAMPKQTAVATASFVAESGAGSEQAPTVGQVLFTPKTVTAYTDFSRLLTKQASFAVDSFVENDLVKGVLTKIENVAWNGGATNEPVGILQNGSVNSVAIGTNGGAPTFAKMVEMETAVAAGNADADAMHYVTSPAGLGKLKTTEKSSGYPVMLVEDGECNGYPIHRTTHIPTDLDKGSSTDILTGVIFGDFSNVHIATWGAPEILVDPYTGGTAGTTRVYIYAEADVQIRFPAGFSVCLDLQY